MTKWYLRTIWQLGHIEKGPDVFAELPFCLRESPGQSNTKHAPFGFKTEHQKCMKMLKRQELPSAKHFVQQPQQRGLCALTELLLVFFVFLVGGNDLLFPEVSCVSETKSFLCLHTIF